MNQLAIYEIRPFSGVKGWKTQPIFGLPGQRLKTTKTVQLPELQILYNNDQERGPLLVRQNPVI